MINDQDLTNTLVQNSLHPPADLLRILYVTPRYAPFVGGTETHTHEVAKRMAEAGHKVTVLTTDPLKQLPPKEYSDGISIRRVPAWPAHKDYYFAPGIVSIICREQWDIIHLQGFHTLVAPLALIAAQQNSAPYWVTFHSGGHSSRIRNLLRPLQRAALRPLLMKAAGLIGVSQWEVNFFRTAMRLPPEKMHHIPNGVALPEIENLPQPGQDTSPLVISVGRLERYKGHHRVIAALPHLVQKIPGLNLVIAGAGPYENNLRQMACDLGVADHIEIRSVPNRQEMAHLMGSASLVVLLSSYESQSISVGEALSLGKPVLVSNSTALREWVDQGLARKIELNSTSEEIAQAILQQIEQPLIPVTAKLPCWERCVEELLLLYTQSILEKAWKFS